MEKTFSHSFHIHLQCLSFSPPLVFSSFSFPLIRNEDFSLSLISEDFHLNIFHLLLVLVNVRNLFCSRSLFYRKYFHSRAKHFVLYAVVWLFYKKQNRRECYAILHNHFLQIFKWIFSLTKKDANLTNFLFHTQNCKLRYWFFPSSLLNENSFICIRA